MTKPTIASLNARIAELEGLVAERDITIDTLNTRIAAAKECYRALRATIPAPMKPVEVVRDYIKHDGTRMQAVRIGNITTHRVMQ